MSQAGSAADPYPTAHLSGGCKGWISVMMKCSNLRHHKFDVAANLGLNSRTLAAELLPVAKPAAIALRLALGLFMLKGSPSRML